MADVEQQISVFCTHFQLRRFDDVTLRILESVLTVKDVKSLLEVRSSLKKFLRSESLVAVREVAEKSVKHQVSTLKFLVRAFAIVEDVESCLALRYEALVMRESKSISHQCLQVSCREWMNFAKDAVENNYFSIAVKACENALNCIQMNMKPNEDELQEKDGIVEEIQRLKHVAMSSSATHSVQVQAAEYLRGKTVKSLKQSSSNNEIEYPASTSFRNATKERNQQPVMAKSETATRPTTHKADHPSSPYFLSSHGSPVTPLVSDVLIGVENYYTWHRLMLIALRAKNKSAFTTGELPQPENTDEFYDSWVMCDSMVFSWILNSVSEEIAASIVYNETSREAWIDIKERYSLPRVLRMYELRRAILELKQGNMSVTTYFTRMKTLWGELQGYESLASCNCNCGVMECIEKNREQDRIMSFLMGLNECYTAVRDQILLMDPLMSVNAVFRKIIQQEKLCELTNSVAMRGNVLDDKSFNEGGRKERLICNHCGQAGHVVDKCFKLHGFPPRYKAKG